MKKINKRLIVITLITLALFSFYTINNLNYIKHLEIKKNYVDHPENISTKQTAINSSFGFKNLKADIYRLETIQYIGGNAIGSEYKKYLYVILDLITELNPYFQHPYIIGQLLLPSYNERYEDLSNDEQDENTQQGIELGLKGVKNFCDMDKIELIKNEDNLQKLWTEDKYKNPCKDYEIPNYLAYIYYYYKHDPKSAALYYKVSSAIEDSTEGSKTMAAIMSGKGGNREKSYFMFINIAKYIKTDDKECLDFAGILEKAGEKIFNEKSVELNGNILSGIEDSRKKLFGEFSEEKENDILSDTNCQNYINKSIRELNLEYIERAEQKFLDKEGMNSVSAQELFDKGYINYLPVDFQQYKDYGIIYYYNNDIKNYDYRMGKYDEISY